MSVTKCLGLTEAACRILALATVLWLAPQAQVLAQSEAPPTSKGENFSAGKPPAQLFASDCTGAGCHKGPQGLTKRLLPGSLTGFLREHYTNSRESAAALANYLSKLPSAAEPKERETRTSRPARPAPGSPDGVTPPSTSESGSISRPDQKESRTPRQSNTRTSRAPAKPEDEAPDKPATAAAPGARAHPGAEPGDKPTPPGRAAQQGRQPAAAAAATPEAAASPPQSAVTAPALSPPAAAPQQFDIFD